MAMVRFLQKISRTSAGMLALAMCPAVSVAATDDFKTQFVTPPAEARPTIWWFWGESITTEHGITQDLEALQRVGFGGVVLYEQVFCNAPDALKSLSPERLARVRFAAAECHRLGLSFEINAGPGFVAGGPWITPALGMQRLVASESRVEGGHRLDLKLPQPPTKLDYYRDVAVLAYPSPIDEKNSGELAPRQRTSEPGNIDLNSLFDVRHPTRVRIAPPPNHAPMLIQLDYGKAATVRSLTYSLRPNAKALVIATQVPAGRTGAHDVRETHAVEHRDRSGHSSLFRRCYI
jgi:hypothetical protein